MKKTLLALAVLASVAGTANAAEILKTDSASVDFYGQLREELKQIDYDDGAKSTDTSTTLKSGSSRAGVTAAYALTDDLKALASVEFGIGQSNSGDNRKHWIGISSDKYGTLTLGKQSIITDDVWGVENDWIGYGYSVLPEASGYDMNWTQNAELRYDVEGDAGWLKVAYGYDNGNEDPTTAELYLGTTVGSFDIYGGVGYQEDKTSSTSTANKTFTGTDNATYTVATTTTSVSDTELKHGMLTVNYNGDGWNLGTTYWHAEVKDNDANTKLTSDSYVVAGAYSITKKTSLYGGYEYINDFQSEGNTYNNVYGGVLYQYASWTKLYAETGYTDSDVTNSDSYYGVGVRVYW
ncbi:porin [Vibrio nitrifigilis]|uniref:Porin n=1 Tax=Vibrio nitrifigilis TaxID=2789781 RepID=A0ABS0GC95_9VIBR|nr:porin [Vibrio nitrifigilis]MBF9000006.1 porin [Vibrio nitrifigilis]